MKENELTRAARDYANTNGNGSGLAEEDFLEGSVWLLDQYNGISPDTVKEMYEALKTQKIIMDEISMGFFGDQKEQLNTALTKAEQELKK